MPVVINGTTGITSPGETVTGNLSNNQSTGGFLTTDGAAQTNFQMNTTTSGAMNWRLTNEGNAGRLRFLGTDGTNTVFPMFLNTGGQVTTPSQTGFSATGTGSVAITPAAVIPINNKQFDTGNNFNTSTYTFTAPIAGKYLFSFSVRYNGYPANVYLHPGLQKNGGTVAQSQGINSIASTVGDAYMSVTNTIILDLAANDTVRLFDGSEGGTTGTYEAGQCVLTGYLLG
jgi:hypothetical protein